ncbi:MAG: hypothetical protein ACK4NR_10595 [Micavibrio sp.]
MSDFSDKLTSLANKFKYHATVLLTPEDPPTRVKQELLKDGWQFKPSRTEEEVKQEILSSAFMTPVVYVPHVYTQVISPEGEEVYGLNSNSETREKYREAVKKAAAKTFNVNPV